MILSHVRISMGVIPWDVNHSTAELKSSSQSKGLCDKSKAESFGMAFSSSKVIRRSKLPLTDKNLTIRNTNLTC